MSGLPTPLALRLFHRLLIENPPLAGVFSLDVAKWCVSHSSMAGAPLFESLVGLQDRPRGASDNFILSGILALPTGRQRREALGRHLKSVVAELLGIPLSKIFDETELSTLGFDSLIAIELVMRLEDDLGTSLPGALSWSAPTIGSLAERIAAELDIPIEPTPPSFAPASGDASSQGLADKSDLEMAELLAAELEAAARHRRGLP
jgi:acyl carrier protein